MGVTIHFEGRLISDNAFQEVMAISKQFAESNDMEYSFIREDNKILYRVKDEKDWNYEGLTKGIKIQPSPDSDPLWLEFDKDNYVQDFCKTQFADIQVHLQIIELFRLLEGRFETFFVEDEGEYWETRNIELLQKHINACFAAIDEATSENKDLTGPFRLEDGRIVDLMERE